MNYLISHNTTHHPFLSITARKKTIKHKLFYVMSGYLSVRVGKEEYLVSAQEAFWLPLECLTALTYFPNSQILEIEISARSRSHYSHQAGYVSPSPLMSALLEKLALHSFSPENIQLMTLLKALNFELESLKPILSNGSITLQEACQKGKNALSFQMSINVRDALKARASGIKREKVITDFFNGSENHANELCLAIANTSLN